MENKNSEINWIEIMDKFSKYEGSIVDFCKTNNIKPHQLYHQRKKLRKKKIQTFHAIDVPKAAELEDTTTIQQSVRIQIGNANIFVPVHDQNTLLTLVRELSKSC